MLKMNEIRELIKLIDKSSIEKFSYEVDGSKIKLTKGSSTKPVTIIETIEEQVPVEIPVAAPASPPTAEVIEPKPTPTSTVVDANVKEIVSPMVGTFYAAASPDADPYASVGQKVQANSIVCIVEAMKLFNEIEAEVAGEIVDVLVQDGQLVEFGQPLFLVKAN